MTNLVNSLKTEGVTNSVHKESRVADIKKTQEGFLKLLIASCKNQDIDNPTDMNQMIGQIVSMNELQTLMGIDCKLDDISKNLSASNDTKMMTNVIGKYALTEGNKVALDENTTTIPISYRIYGDSQTNALMKLVSDTGDVIHEIRLQDIVPNQFHNLELNLNNINEFKPGLYNIQIIKNDGKIVPSSVYASHKIEQITSKGDLIMDNKQKTQINEVLALQEKPMYSDLEYSQYTHSNNTRSKVV